MEEGYWQEAGAVKGYREKTAERNDVDFDSPSRFMALMDTQLGMFEAVENFVRVCIGDAVSATERDWTRMVTVRRVMVLGALIWSGRRKAIQKNAARLPRGVVRR